MSPSPGHEMLIATFGKWISADGPVADEHQWKGFQWTLHHRWLPLRTGLLHTFSWKVSISISIPHVPSWQNCMEFSFRCVVSIASLFTVLRTSINIFTVELLNIICILCRLNLLAWWFWLYRWICFGPAVKLIIGSERAGPDRAWVLCGTRWTHHPSVFPFNIQHCTRQQPQNRTDPE